MLASNQQCVLIELSVPKNILQAAIKRLLKQQGPHERGAAGQSLPGQIGKCLPVRAPGSAGARAWWGLPPPRGRVHHRCMNFFDRS